MNAPHNQPWKLICNQRHRRTSWELKKAETVEQASFTDSSGGETPTHTHPLNTRGYNSSETGTIVKAAAAHTHAQRWKKYPWVGLGTEVS